MSMTPQRIAILMGGASAEREISVKSGNAVLQALKGEGLDAVAVDLSTNTQLWVQQIEEVHADMAFIALHGTYGEDGCVQGMLEILNIPYTGSGVTASALCMHKGMTKAVLHGAGIAVPQDVVLRDGCPQAYPVFVKPMAEGSSVGLYYVADAAAWAGLDLGMQQQWLVEPCVQGVEVAVSVLAGKALPPVEVAPKSGVYDFDAKYTQGATDYYCPARLSEQRLQQCMDIAEKAVAVLGCSGAPRVDFIVPAEGEPVVLEVNTIPGMTATSLLPKAAAALGIDFARLCMMILRNSGLVLQADCRGDL